MLVRCAASTSSCSTVQCSTRDTGRRQLIRTAVVILLSGSCLLLPREHTVVSLMPPPQSGFLEISTISIAALILVPDSSVFQITVKTFLQSFIYNRCQIKFYQSHAFSLAFIFFHHLNKIAYPKIFIAHMAEEMLSEIGRCLGSRSCGSLRWVAGQQSP